MSDHENAAKELPVTPLRADYARARDLDVESQMREVVDHLEHPQILQGELLDAARSIASCVEEGDAPCVGAGTQEEEELLLVHFYPRREITVTAEEPFVFTCMAGELDPIPGARPEDEPSEGFDYVGLLQDRERAGILGVSQNFRDATPYVLLLRALAGLAELLPAAQSTALDRAVFKGALGDQPIFDLHLVLFDDEPAPTGPDDPRVALSQLTRDLADVVKNALAGDTEFPAELGRIVCLRMDPDAFEGELQLEWEV